MINDDTVLLLMGTGNMAIHRSRFWVKFRGTRFSDKGEMLNLFISVDKDNMYIYIYKRFPEIGVPPNHPL